jgi:Zn-dependent protease
MFEIITIVILILSIVLHEVAHGYAANWLGDPTARLAGRLTANPIPHIDPVGSVLIPGILFLTSAPFLFGWAKPVPYNPYNLNNQKWGESIVAAAGPLTNLLLAIIFATVIRFSEALGLSLAFAEMAGYIVFINILLALFNAIPFPPLDGSKIIVPFPCAHRIYGTTRLHWPLSVRLYHHANSMEAFFSSSFLGFSSSRLNLEVLVRSVFSCYSTN